MKYFPKLLTVTWLKNSYRHNKLTPLEVAEEIVRRAKLTKDKNVYIIEPDLSWIKPYIDRLGEYDPETLPLWGIPFVIKDNIDLEGLPTTAGCPDYSYRPQESAAVVKKLIAAGAVPVGKANLDQFATGLVGTRSPYGEVHNALKDELISGGSSSGSAVSVALGQAAFSLGTDTAGSGRVPAALNALVGYKPSLGAWSTKGVVPACASIDCVTVFANNLDDVRLVNQIARGFDYDCSWSREFPDIKEELPMKIFLVKNPEFYGPFKKIYQEKWDRAVSRIKSLEIPVEYPDDTIFKEAASILYEGPWIAERWKDLGQFVNANPGKVFPVTESILRMGDRPELTAAKLFEALHKLQAYRAKVKVMLKDAVLIMPTAGGTYTREEVRNNPVTPNLMMGNYTNHCNLLDMCAVAIPSEEEDREDPFGITVFGLSEAEGLVLGTAGKYQGMQTMQVAVCGLHMQGFPLESQLVALNAVFAEEAVTAPYYRLYKLDTIPVKPGLIRVRNGHGILIELYDLPVENFGKFINLVKAPLCIGDIMLEDGRTVKGFLCEDYARETAEDISVLGSFRNISPLGENC